MRTAEKIVVFIVIFVGLGMLAVSLVSLYNDLSLEKGVIYYVVDLIFFAFSVFLIGGGIRLYRRILAYEALADVIVDEVLYERLKPLLEQIAFSTAEMDEVKAKLSEIENELKRLESIEHKAPTVGNVVFYVKTIMVAMFFFGFYLFMINFILPYEVFLYVVLYVIWWAFITQEFRLLDRMEAWIVLCIPILIVPSASIIIDSLFGMVAARAVVFWSAVIYAYLYYLYAKKLATSPREPIRFEHIKAIKK